MVRTDLVHFFAINRRRDLKTINQISLLKYSEISVKIVVLYKRTEREKYLAPPPRRDVRRRLKANERDNGESEVRPRAVCLKCK